MAISRERAGSNIHEDLDMLVACFLPGRAKDLSAPLYIKKNVGQILFTLLRKL